MRASAIVLAALLMAPPALAMERALSEAEQQYFGQTLQPFVKQTSPPHPYPRSLEFRHALPRTETGKLQRFRLRAEAPARNPEATK